MANAIHLNEKNVDNVSKNDVGDITFDGCSELDCVGVGSLVSDKEDPEFDDNGYFLTVHKRLADSLISRDLGKHSIPILLNHTDNTQIGHVTRLSIDSNINLNNKHKNRLIVGYTITDSNFIHALKLLAYARLKYTLHGEKYAISSDGFLPILPEVAHSNTVIDSSTRSQDKFTYNADAKWSLLSHTPGLSFGHFNKNQDFDVRELSLCAVGMRDASVTYTVNLKRKRNKQTLHDQNAVNKYLAILGCSFTAASTPAIKKAQRDSAMLNDTTHDKRHFIYTQLPNG